MPSIARFSRELSEVDLSVTEMDELLGRLE
jgi:hypothetical protein